MQQDGYADLMQEWEKIKQNCLKGFENDNLLPEQLKENQLVYKRILLWLDIPNKFIRDGEEEIHNLEQERLQENEDGRPLKGISSLFNRK